MWPDRRLLDLLGIELPIVQAPMAAGAPLRHARRRQDPRWHHCRRDLLARLKAAGCKILSSATSVKEASWLAERGVDAVIAQGAEAGGHRGMFLDTDVAAQVGAFALVPHIADAVSVPVIAAGGARGCRSLRAWRGRRANWHFSDAPRRIS